MLTTDTPIEQPSRPLSTLELAGLSIAAVPFFFGTPSISISRVNGVVVSFVYRDWLAVLCAGIALAVALASILALRSPGARSWRRILFVAGVLLLGLWQLARGFGLFMSPAGV